MQITIDTDDNKVANQILEMLERYKKKGVEIATPEHRTPHNTFLTDDNKNLETNSLEANFKSILGKYAKERANVSIGEDRKILQDALWQKYGQ